MPATAQLRSANAVLNWYNDQDHSAWKIYRFTVADKNCTDQYNGINKEDGLERLQTALSYIAPDDYENYVIALFNPKDKDKKAPAINKVFVVNERPAGMVGAMVGYSGISPQQHQINTEILNELRALREARITEEADEEEEEAEDSIVAGSETERILDKVNGIINNPMIAQLLGMLMPAIVNRPAQQISGTHTAEDLQKILETLFSKGVTPDDLAKLAAMDQGQITFLLGMLRK